MIAKITLITSLSIAVFYPYCLFISFNDPLKEYFHRFHIGMPAVVGGVLFFIIINGYYCPAAQLLATLWIAVLLIVTVLSWNKESLNPINLILPCLLGALTYGAVYAQLVGTERPVLFVGVLSSYILCASLYAMNLGHWYLNVHGLNIKHLKSACYMLWVLLFIRLIWNVFQMFNSNIIVDGMTLTLIKYSISMDGFLLWIPILFGTIFPFGAMFMVNEILKLKNTQATTGVLYVILCGILIGDIAYKYFLLHYGIIL